MYSGETKWFICSDAGFFSLRKWLEKVKVSLLYCTITSRHNVFTHSLHIGLEATAALGQTDISKAVSHQSAPPTQTFTPHSHDQPVKCPAQGHSDSLHQSIVDLWTDTLNQILFEILFVRAQLDSEVNRIKVMKLPRL